MRSTTKDASRLPPYPVNEIQPVEWGGTPTSIEFPPERAGEPCVHHVYKDVAAVPDEAYARIGLTRGGRRPSDA